MWMTLVLLGLFFKAIVGIGGKTDYNKEIYGDCEEKIEDEW